MVWIAGGLAKQGGIEPLAAFFPRIARALLIGRDAPMLAATLAAHNVPHDIVGTLDAAHRRRRSPPRAPPPRPSCCCRRPAPAWDQFTGFEARGDRFAALVAALAQERAA